MKIITTITKMHQEIARARRQGKTIGFVPTMGYLHQGHTKLLHQCRKENTLCVLSIFVNPLQFGPKEDFRRYPRDKKHDESLAKKEKVDIIFYPSERIMYPTGYLTYVHVNALTDSLCGFRRSGHFDGVTTVVAKLINIVQPHIIYFGQKDAQQAIVVAQMIQDLNWPVKMKTVPTVRDTDGLAMSSRNRYLSAQERKQALAIYRALCVARKRVKSGERNTQKLLQATREIIMKNPSAKIDYAACVDAKTLSPVKKIQGCVLVALAVFIGKTRLIDNFLIRV